jgi:ribosomal protein S18 acetylase RimI-like enzyme
MKHFQIIEANDSHIDFLAHFGQKSFIDTYKEALSLKDLEAYTNNVFSISNITAAIKNPLITYFVCKDLESNLYGYSKLIQSSPPECIHSNSSIELQRLYIDKNYIGQGLGKLLLTHTELHAENLGFNSIFLKVWDGNIIAIKKYLKWNYSIVGKENYQVGEAIRTVILMRKYCRK